jgi:hypothetical protein
MVRDDESPPPPPPTDDDAPPKPPVALVKPGGVRPAGECRRADGVLVDPGEWHASMSELEAQLAFSSLLQGKALKSLRGQSRRFCACIHIGKERSGTM